MTAFTMFEELLSAVRSIGVNIVVACSLEWDRSSM
jgi:hypothetical protein